MADREKNHRRAFSVLAQSAYGTALDDGDIDLAVPLTGPTFIEDSIGYQDDKDEVGKGHSHATRLDQELMDNGLEWPGPLTSFLAAYLAAFGMGQVSTDHLCALGSVTFTGVGLDDMTASGTPTAGSAEADYMVEIDGEATPDTFKWSNDGGSTWEATGVAITGAAQELENGISVTFAATTGHTSGESWDFVSAYTTAYKHTSTESDLDSNSGQNPVTTMIDVDGAGEKNKVRDLVLDNFKISGKMKERLQFTSSWIGSGHSETSAKVMPSVTQGSFLRMRGATAQLGEAASLQDISQRVKGFEFGYNNNSLKDEGHTPGSGLYRSECQVGERAATFTLTVRSGSATERAQYKNGTELKCVITCVGASIESGYYHQTTLTIEKLKIKDCKRAYENGREVYNIECEPFYYNTDSSPAKIETINTQAYYLAAP